MPLIVNGEALHDAILADGLPRFAMADDNSLHVLYLDGEKVRSMEASDWKATHGSIPNDPSDDEIKAAVAAREAARKAQQVALAAHRQRVLQAAQDIVGVSAGQLTAVQLREAVKLLLELAGALDSEEKVKPLDQWVR